MALKDWKKLGASNEAWKKGNKEILLDKRSDTPHYWDVLLFDNDLKIDDGEIIETTYTKKEAVAFAMKYMRSH